MILVVDDDCDILAAVRRTLKSINRPLHAVDSPLEALEILAREQVEVLVSDVDMPEMSGLELLGRVRQSWPDVVRILMTGRSSLDSAVRAINVGEVHRFICKPFDADELRGMVTEALARRVELGRASRAGIVVERRSLLLEQLEEECPGITQFDRDADGTYRLDRQRCRRGEQMLASFGVVVHRH